MAYRVVRYFTDLQDNNHAYNAGDLFPREGMTVSNERINELVSAENKQHTQLIRYEDEEESAEMVVYTEDSLSDMTTKEIKALAADRGYKITKNSKADVIEQFLKQQG